MKLIVGLGNVGSQYAKTRHNLGFMVADHLATTAFRKHSKAAAEICDLRPAHDAILVKPTTMMNLSGRAVGELGRFYKLDPADVWVIYDDADLQFGQLRVRQGGATGGGHNGVKSVIEHVGEDFWRIRLGVSNEHRGTTATDRFVLDNFSADEAKQLPELVEHVGRYLLVALNDGQPDDHTRSLV
jgi:PTH1 family peptidyl-tRNA hydrolase